MSDHAIQHIFILWNSQSAITILNNRMRTTGIESCDNPAFFIPSNWKLCLISIMIWFIHTDQRLHRKVMKSTDPLQMTPKFLFFKHFLFFIRNCLKLTSATLAG